MDKRVFFIDMPELDDKAVAGIQKFLWNIIQSFESQYLHQLQRYHQQLTSVDDIENLF